MKKDFEISVIVKLAGNKKMLDRTMHALTGQTLPFGENIQVVLLANAAAETMCRKISEEYLKTYPENVIWQNELDMEALQGKYINCLREGQFWHKEAFESMKNICATAVEEVDILMEDYKEEEEEESNYLTYTQECAENATEEQGRYIFKNCYKEQIAQMVNAEEKLQASLAILKILVNTKNMAVLRNVKMCGKRCSYREKTRDWYLNELPEFVNTLEEMKQSGYKGYKNNIDFFKMYQIAESLKDDVDGILDENDILQYKAWMKATLQTLSDYIIIKGRMNGATRTYALAVKYGSGYKDELKYRNGKITFKNLIIYNLNEGKFFEIEDTKKTETETIVRVKIVQPFPKELLEYAMQDGELREYPFHFVESRADVCKCLKEKVMKEQIYECHVPVTVNQEELKFLTRYNKLFCLVNPGVEEENIDER